MIKTSHLSTKLCQSHYYWIKLLTNPWILEKVWKKKKSKQRGKHTPHPTDRSEVKALFINTLIFTVKKVTDVNIIYMLLNRVKAEYKYFQIILSSWLKPFCLYSTCALPLGMPKADTESFYCVSPGILQIGRAHCRYEWHVCPERGISWKPHQCSYSATPK